MRCSSQLTLPKLDRVEGTLQSSRGEAVTRLVTNDSSILLVGPLSLQDNGKFVQQAILEEWLISRANERLSQIISTVILDIRFSKI